MSDQREAAEKRFVSDDYFSKEHLWTKIRITAFTIIAWFAVIIPIYWTVSSTLLAKHPAIYHVWHYREGKAIYYRVGFLFLIAAAVLALTAILLTLHNNYKMKHHVHKELQYDPHALHQREQALEEFYSHRFGDAEQRHTVRFYSVPAQKNLETDTIQEVFKKAGAADD